MNNTIRRRGWRVRLARLGAATAVALVGAVALPAAPAHATTSGSVSIGWDHTCVTGTKLDSGAPMCWGHNDVGELGNGTLGVNSATPVAVDTSGALNGVTLTQIAAMGSISCGLSSTGRAYCWGDNEDGALGDGTTTTRTSPVAVDTSGVLNGVTLTELSANAWDTMCGLSTAGRVYCWGYDGDGGLGNGDNTYTNSPVPVAVDTSGVLNGQTVTQISGGYYGMCALTSAGHMYCWGSNYGTFGNGSTAISTVPVATDTSGVLNGVTIAQMGKGLDHSCALSTTGHIYCWGDDNHGQLGDGGSTTRLSPVAVDESGVLSGLTITAITVGDSHTCALSSAGGLYCWGDNGSGQLGIGTTTDSNVPVAVDTSGALSGKTITSVAAGDADTCVTTARHGLYCWGDNTYGAIGDGTTTQRNTAVEVIPEDTAPGAPTSLTATPGSGSADLSFTAPSDTGGAAITGYQYTVDGGDTWHDVTTSGTAPVTATVTGLTNGTAYQIAVRAVNDAGPGPGSTAAPVTPEAAVPGMPTSVTATAGTSSITVQWTAPVGGVAPTGYTAIASPGPATCTTDGGTSCVLGAVAGTSYTITVVAHSAGGDSSPSDPSSAVTASAPVPPASPPSTTLTLTTTKGAISTASPGEQITVVGTGFAAYSTATVTVYSAAVSLGTVTTDAHGDFSVPVTLPASLSAGVHEVVALGVAPDGTPRAMKLTVAVSSGGLPVTGLPLLGIVLLGLVLLGSGAALWYHLRIRRLAVRVGDQSPELG